MLVFWLKKSDHRLFSLVSDIASQNANTWNPPLIFVSGRVQEFNTYWLESIETYYQISDNVKFMNIKWGGIYHHKWGKVIVVYMCHLVICQQLYKIKHVTFTLILSYLHFFGQSCVKEIPLYYKMSWCIKQPSAVIVARYYVILIMCHMLWLILLKGSIFWILINYKFVVVVGHVWANLNFR